MYQAFEKRSAINISFLTVFGLNFSLKHPTTGLIKAVEFKLAKDLLLVGWQCLKQGVYVVLWRVDGWVEHIVEGAG